MQNALNIIPLTDKTTIAVKGVDGFSVTVNKRTTAFRVMAPSTHASPQCVDERRGWWWWGEGGEETSQDVRACVCCMRVCCVCCVCERESVCVYLIIGLTMTVLCCCRSPSPPLTRAIEAERNTWVEAIEAAIAMKSGRTGMPALLESQIKKLTTIIAKMIKDMTTLSSVSNSAHGSSSSFVVTLFFLGVGWLVGFLFLFCQAIVTPFDLISFPVWFLLSAHHGLFCLSACSVLLAYPSRPCLLFPPSSSTGFSFPLLIWCFFPRAVCRPRRGCKEDHIAAEPHGAARVGALRPARHRQARRHAAGECPCRHRVDNSRGERSGE